MSYDRVFRRDYIDEDDVNDNYFPPLETVALPIPHEKFPRRPEEDEDEEDYNIQDNGLGSPQSGYEDEPVGGLPPPTEPLFENDVDMVAFRKVVEQAGIKEFFQQVCSDILLQRPDDVFKFTSKQLRAEARRVFNKRVVEEKLIQQTRAEELKNLALEEQQRKITEMIK